MKKRKGPIRHDPLTITFNGPVNPNFMEVSVEGKPVPRERLKVISDRVIQILDNAEGSP